MAARQKKSLTLKQVADHCRGELIGNPDTVISVICALDDQVAGGISFVRDLEPAQIDNVISQAKASAFIVPQGSQSLLKSKKGNFVCATDPFAALISLIPLLAEPVKPNEGISSKAEIDPSVTIGKDVSIGAFAVIGRNAVIGDYTIIHPQVTLYPDCKIGKNCIIHAGAVIRENCHVGNDSTIHAGAIVGSEGFGYVPDPQLGLRPIPQIGGVRLADRVDVGANSCIDRATLGNTVLGLSTKVDNLVQIGHNVKLGTHCILCAQAGIAGSTTIGDRVTFAGNSGVADHLTIVSDVRVGAKAAVIQSIEEKGDYSGMPAIPARQWHRQNFSLQKLSELTRRVRALEKEKQ
jgi:UDP-3-O-[3-hydroxymyristoyl] glucosamine N-acyltransferase